MNSIKLLNKNKQLPVPFSLKIEMAACLLLNVILSFENPHRVPFVFSVVAFKAIESA